MADSAVKDLLKGKSDAIQCASLAARIIKGVFVGTDCHAFIARVDSPNLWKDNPSPREGCRRMLCSISIAVRTGAGAVMCFLLVGYQSDAQ